LFGRGKKIDYYLYPEKESEVPPELDRGLAKSEGGENDRLSVSILTGRGAVLRKNMEEERQGVLLEEALGRGGSGQLAAKEKEVSRSCGKEEGVFNQKKYDFLVRVRGTMSIGPIIWGG